jgi:hypothetical protein
LQAEIIVRLLKELGVIRLLKKLTTPEIWVHTAVPIIPFAGLTAKKAYILWPPLGSLNVYAAVMASVLLATLCPLLPSLISTRAAAKRWILASAIVAAVCFSGYGFLVGRYIVPANPPGKGTQYQSVGYERTQAAQIRYPGISNEALLEKVPLNDAGIEQAWTAQSVYWVRLSLFFSYVLALGSVNFAAASRRRMASLRR